MNLPTIKLLCWLVAAGSAGGLAYYVYDYFKHFEEKRSPVDRAYVEAVLNEELHHAPEVRQIVDYKSLIHTFKDMNWTGKPPPPPIEPKTDVEQDTGPKYQPIAEILSVEMIREDTSNPSGSVAYVFVPKLNQNFDLRIGDELPAPFDFAVVHGIRSTEVEFAFKDPERENEVVGPGQLDDALIVSVGAGDVIAPTRDSFAPGPGKSSSAAPQTRQIARNNYELGIDDMSYFGENYSQILTEDVTTRTYMKDGKRAGVEITSVSEGSIASRHGVHTGDVLISINGHKVHSQSEAIQFVKKNSDTTSVWEVKVMRYGKVETQVYHSPND